MLFNFGERSAYQSNLKSTLVRWLVQTAQDPGVERMAEEPLEISCEHHGKCIAAVVCGHLSKNNGTSLGFVENNSDPNDLQAWCYACEYVFRQENDKTESFRAFTGRAIVCSGCYADIKQKHTAAT